MKMKKVIYQFQVNQSEILGTFETKQENYKSGSLISTESITMICINSMIIFLLPP